MRWHMLQEIVQALFVAWLLYGNILAGLGLYSTSNLSNWTFAVHEVAIGFSQKRKLQPCENYMVSRLFCAAL